MDNNINLVGNYYYNIEIDLHTAKKVFGSVKSNIFYLTHYKNAYIP